MIFAVSGPKMRRLKFIDSIISAEKIYIISENNPQRYSEIPAQYLDTLLVEAFSLKP